METFITSNFTTDIARMTSIAIMYHHHQHYHHSSNAGAGADGGQLRITCNTALRCKNSFVFGVGLAAGLEAVNYKGFSTLGGGGSL